MARDADPTDLLADLDSSSNAVLSARSKARSKAYLPSAVVGTSTAIFDSHLGSSMQAVL